MSEDSIYDIDVTCIGDTYRTIFNTLTGKYRRGDKITHNALPYQAPTPITEVT